MQTTVSVPRRSSSVLVQAQLFSLPVVFALFGVIMGSWAGRIPALAAGVNVSHAALSMVLLCGGLGAVISYPISSFLMGRFGARKTLMISGLALLCVLVSIGMAPDVSRLMMAVLMLGITASTFDVAMNSAAARREKESGKSEMSRLHGLACAGGLVGATLGSLMASMKIAPATHFLMLAGPLAVVLWLAVNLLEADEAGVKVEKKKFALPRGPLVLLGLLGFFGSMAEGSIADWSGLFLKEHFGASDGLAPLALSSFSVMMLMSRMVGDKMKERYGAKRLVTLGALVAAAGLFFAVLAPNAYVALGGFAIAGVGLALVFPFVFSAAGAQGPAALAAVASMAYSGSLMGPPAIGAVAHFIGMQAAIAYVGGLSLVIAMVACRTRLLK
ncbi:MFS transporter [Massilia timonae]|uniref:Major Facilitator Superfamily protein n=1 Tax=Massilia timonae TaxID=47229 RepID=A0A1S2N6N5_9BURK|nr:MFS transporter [Massilia timonae]OIJ40563.1 major Facilitator Superfamily protein [Massilia timonae]